MSAFRDLERCARSHGAFSWRDIEPQHARAEVVWDASAAPTQSRIASSTFPRDVDACILGALPALAVTPPPSGRVALTVRFDRD